MKLDLNRFYELKIMIGENIPKLDPSNNCNKQLTTLKKKLAHIISFMCK